MFVNIKYVLFLLPPYTISDMYIKLSRYVIIIATHVFRVSDRVAFKSSRPWMGFCGYMDKKYFFAIR